MRGTDGTFRRYLITAFPMRLHTFQNNPAPRNTAAPETHVLRSALENQPATYRLAIRPDGTAQIYVDGALVGTTTGEILSTDVPRRSYLRIGKTITGGEWAARIYHLGFDSAGAFSPAPAAAGGLRELRVGDDIPGPENEPGVAVTSMADRHTLTLPASPGIFFRRIPFVTSASLVRSLPPRSLRRIRPHRTPSLTRLSSTIRIASAPSKGAG